MSWSFPVLLQNLAGATFFVYAGMCVVAVLFVAALVPETKGKSLEEIERQWTGRKFPQAPLCLKCGYNLRGQTIARCPECGEPFPEKLLQGRRPGR